MTARTTPNPLTWLIQRDVDRMLAAPARTSWPTGDVAAEVAGEAEAPRSGHHDLAALGRDSRDGGARSRAPISARGVLPPTATKSVVGGDPIAGGGSPPTPSAAARP